MFIGLVHLSELLLLVFSIGKKKSIKIILKIFIFHRAVWAHHDRRLFVKNTKTTTTTTGKQ
jgi:hypothetical protein